MQIFDTINLVCVLYYVLKLTFEKHSRMFTLTWKFVWHEKLTTKNSAFKRVISLLPFWNTFGLLSTLPALQLSATNSFGISLCCQKGIDVVAESFSFSCNGQFAAFYEILAFLRKKITETSFADFVVQTLSKSYSNARQTTLVAPISSITFWFTVRKL